MTTALTTGLARADDGAEAARRATQDAADGLDDEPILAMVFSAPQYDYEAVVAAVRETVPGASLLGASTAGEFAGSEVSEDGVVVALLASDEMDVYTGLGRGVSEDPEGAVAAAAADLPDEYDRPHAVGINLHDGVSGLGEELAMLAYQEYPIPYVGGSAADGLALEETHVFVDDAVESDAVALGLLVSETPFGLAVQHGHEPITGPMTVTAAEGGTVAELDGRPAFDVYREAIREPASEHYGIDVDDLDAEAFRQVLTFFEFGVRTGDDDFKVRWPGLTPDTDGPMAFPGTIPEGTELHVMHSPKEGQIESAREAGRTAVDAIDGVPAGALVFDCACRGAILGDEFDQAVAAMGEQLDAPLAGFETYGEVNLQPGEMRGFHNTTSSVLLFSR